MKTHNIETLQKRVTILCCINTASDLQLTKVNPKLFKEYKVIHNVKHNVWMATLIFNE